MLFLLDQIGIALYRMVSVCTDPPNGNCINVAQSSIDAWGLTLLLVDD